MKNLNVWTRSSDGIVAGVSVGLAEKLEMNVTWIRIAWIISVLFFGFGLAIYIVFALCLPLENDLSKNFRPMLLGVCHRLSTKMNWDVGILRSSACFLAIGSFGTILVIYLLLHVFLPKTDDGSKPEVIDL